MIISSAPEFELLWRKNAASFVCLSLFFSFSPQLLVASLCGWFPTLMMMMMMMMFSQEWSVFMLSIPAEH
jgi:hypothetical protein